MIHIGERHHINYTAWNPNLRSKAAIRTSDTRYFVDLSVATAALGIGPMDLVNDLELMGLLFGNRKDNEMIQDIYPSRLKNEYYNYNIRERDHLLVFDSDGKILVGEKDSDAIFLRGKDISANDVVYLFSLDETRFFLKMGDQHIIKEGFDYYPIRDVRNRFSQRDVFVIFTGYHLWKWYNDNKFCGKCGHNILIEESERALRCPECGNTIYPRINPAVIVGVIKRDCILITKYRNGYSHNALVAGFAEIGETLEETVAREVMEEAGVLVKNIRYYKSQPWGIAQDLLAGFFCEADGDGEIHMDEKELKYADWVKREDIELQPNNLSLTNEMMRVFKENSI